VLQSISIPTKSFPLSRRQTRMGGGVWNGSSNLPSTRFYLSLSLSQLEPNGYELPLAK